MSLLAVLLVPMAAVALGPRGGPLARLAVGVGGLVRLDELPGRRVELAGRRKWKGKVGFSVVHTFIANPAGFEPFPSPSDQSQLWPDYQPTW